MNKFLRRIAACVVVAAGIVFAPCPAAAVEVRIHGSNSELVEQSKIVVDDALSAFEERLPAGEAPIEIVICDTVAQFRALGARAGASRIQGFAYSEEGVIVIRAPKLLNPKANYAAILRHELLHVLLARATAKDHLPRWLNEGVAMVLSRENRWWNAFEVARMYAGGRIIKYSELPYAFAAPGNEREFGAAYAQSLSMTRHLMDKFGEENFWGLIGDLKDRNFEQVLETRSGLTPHEFFEDWEKGLWKVALVTSIVSGFSIFQVMALLLLLAFAAKKWRGRRILRQWEEEEDADDIVLPWELENSEPYWWERD